MRVQKGEGDNNRSLATKGLEKQIDGDSTVRIGKVEVSVGGGGKKLKVRRVNEGGGGALAVTREEGKGKDVNVKVVAEAGILKSQQEPKVNVKEKVQANAGAVNSNAHFHFIPVYNYVVEDRKWATSGLIATVHGGIMLWHFSNASWMLVFPMLQSLPWGG